MPITWTIASTLYANPIDDLTEADLVAEVIASKAAHADYLWHRKYGPGEITDLEHNMEKIYEV